MDAQKLEICLESASCRRRIAAATASTKLLMADAGDRQIQAQSAAGLTAGNLQQFDPELQASVGNRAARASLAMFQRPVSLNPRIGRQTLPGQPAGS